VEGVAPDRIRNTIAELLREMEVSSSSSSGGGGGG